MHNIQASCGRGSRVCGPRDLPQYFFKKIGPFDVSGAHFCYHFYYCFIFHTSLQYHFHHYSVHCSFNCYLPTYIAVVILSFLPFFFLVILNLILPIQISLSAHLTFVLFLQIPTLPTLVLHSLMLSSSQYHLFHRNRDQIIHHLYRTCF